MFKRLLAGAFLVLLLSVQGLAQSHSNFPVDILPASTPRAFMADGRTRLVYELHLTNFVPWAIELKGIDVFGAGSSPVASYRGEALEKLVVPAEKLFHAVDSTASAAKTVPIGEGHSAVIFFDLTLDAGVRPPAELRHRFSFSFEGKNGSSVERIVDGVVVPVVLEPVVLRAPLRGGRWVAFNAFSNGSSPDHRRAFNAVDGRVRIAERFAIDWMCLGQDGRLFRGDSKSNANFYSYGAEVLAVADGRVSDLKDGLLENVGSNERSGRAISLDNIVGNYVTLDLGKEHYALYAHLQPGSLKVKLGDAVKAGQVLALVGNSGNSDAPHLHFQLMDANSPMASEGIPYELETFTQLGLINLPDALDAGQPWQPQSQETPVVHRREFPVNNAVVIFP